MLSLEKSLKEKKYLLVFFSHESTHTRMSRNIETLSFRFVLTMWGFKALKKALFHIEWRWKVLKDYAKRRWRGGWGWKKLPTAEKNWFLSAVYSGSFTWEKRAKPDEKLRQWIVFLLIQFLHRFLLEGEIGSFSCALASVPCASASSRAQQESTMKSLCVQQKNKRANNSRHTESFPQFPAPDVCM